MKKISFATIALLTSLAAPSHAATEKFFTATYTFDATVNSIESICYLYACGSVPVGDPIPETSSSHRLSALEVGRTYQSKFEITYSTLGGRGLLTACNFGGVGCPGSQLSNVNFEELTETSFFSLGGGSIDSLLNFRGLSYRYEGDFYSIPGGLLVFDRASLSISNLELTLTPVPLPAGLVLMLTGMATLRTFGRKANKKLASQEFAAI